MRDGYTSVSTVIDRYVHEAAASVERDEIGTEETEAEKREMRDDELDLPSLADVLLGARILRITEIDHDGEEWTELTLDNGFSFQFSGVAIVSHPLPN